ncbi:hypothetical protein E2R60_13370 [Paenibacillus dendritiformis]|uniref:hypothetical protein n=1 Tax=Paenibacillus dendritiformis TaxID=130049 RepID=UPI00105AAF67|nr:hypothetical protein [Paenibacillus dendritiformis]TDL54009.1 hypothetical protein E2R60_13370 [Paenibacillus dendritiformis]
MEFFYVRKHRAGIFSMFRKHGGVKRMNTNLLGESGIAYSMQNAHIAGGNVWYFDFLGTSFT